MHSERKRRRVFTPGDVISLDESAQSTRPHGVNGRTHRKALQLCAQVLRTLNCVLVGDADPVLRDLLVVDVCPAPDTKRMLVSVVLAPSAAEHDPGEVLSHLHRAQGHLRSEVAAEITRKKAPELNFRVLSA
jgi:ribosome-binding factor A